MERAKKAKLVTRAAAARALGVAPARINRWVADGAPVAAPGRRGHSAMYDLEALRAWRRARDRGHGVTQGERDLSLAEARARRETRQAELYELRLLRERGEVLPRAQVVREGQLYVGAVQARLRAIPSRAVQGGIVAQAQQGALEDLIEEAVVEMSRWSTALELQQAVDAAEGEARGGRT